MSKKPDQVKKFTGYHATIMIVAFFAVVVTVNMVMARFALSTFSGTVVDNSYVASQKYNQWLEQARAQKALGWTVSEAVRKADRASIIVTGADQTGLRGARIEALAEHPIGRSEPFELDFVQTGPGEYQSIQPLPAGRWKLKIIVTRDNEVMRVIRDVM